MIRQNVAHRILDSLEAREAEYQKELGEEKDVMIRAFTRAALRELRDIIETIVKPVVLETIDERSES